MAKKDIIASEPGHSVEAGDKLIVNWLFLKEIDFDLKKTFTLVVDKTMRMLCRHNIIIDYQYIIYVFMVRDSFRLF